MGRPTRFRSMFNLDSLVDFSALACSSLFPESDSLLVMSDLFLVCLAVNVPFLLWQDMRHQAVMKENLVSELINLKL